MSFLIPEPEIDLYTTGFPQDDVLNRKPEGERLSRLVEEIDQPMVVALDGGWGSGKTVFLKYWVGQHIAEHPDTKCVYFDAFANDFRDQPLTGLVAELASRFSSEDTIGTQAVHILRKHAGKIALTTLRIGLAAATAGLSEGAIAGADKAVDAAADEAAKQSGDALGDAAETFLAAEDAQVSAMAAFRKQLIALTEPDDQDQPTKRLVFVVDELDRCRPDYALSVLETIKHFFAIPGVHFVLGTNIDALSASVNARYGLNERSRSYLTKFVDIALNLPDKADTGTGADRAEVALFSQNAKACGLTQGLNAAIQAHLDGMDPEHRLSLRETRKLAMHAKLIDAVAGQKVSAYHTILAGLLWMRVARPGEYQLFLEDKLRSDHVASYIVDNRFSSRVLDAWRGFYCEKNHTQWPYNKTHHRESMISLLNAFSIQTETE